MSENKRIINNFIWRAMERVGAQGIAFVISIVLARILDPAVYGIVALVTAITTILNVLVDSGLGTALIQKEDADNLDFSTVFWFNLIMCATFYVGMFFLAGIISDFYQIPELKNIVRVLSISIIISAVKNVQQAYVSRNLIFKRFFFATMGGTLASGVVGVFFALNGAGAWALVAQNLTNQFIDTLILWLTVKWRPDFRFSFERFKSLFSYGWKLLATSLIDNIYTQSRQLIIGKKYSSESLAYYNHGDKLPSFFVSSINSSIDSVLLPVLSKEQNNPARIKTMMRRTIKTSTYLIMPAIAGFAACAPALVKIVLTEKWLPCIPYLRIFCLGYAFYPINAANLNAVKAMGRSDIALKLEIAKKTVGMISILIAMNISTMAMAYSVLFASFCAQIINAYPIKTMLNYSYFRQIKDILPQTLLTCIMLILVLLTSILPLNEWGILFTQVVVGILVYLIGSKLLNLDDYKYLKRTLKSYLRNR